MNVLARGYRLCWLLSAAAMLPSGCAKPPPAVALSPVGPSTPVVAAVVAAQATLLQARYGCTMGGCGPGYACDKKTRLCKALESGAGVQATSTSKERKKEACVGSPDGLVSLCLQPPAGTNSFRLRAQNAGPSVVALSLRELYVSEVRPCAAATDAPAQGGTASTALATARPLGLRLATATSDPASEPRSTLFLAPGPDVDLDVGFEVDRRSECALEISATFEVTHATLTLSIELPPLGGPQ